MADATRKLPVFETVGKAISYSLKNIVLMVRLAWLWVLVVLAVGVAAFVLASLTGAQFDRGSDGLGMAAIMSLAIVIVVYTIALYSVAVGWHRGLLLGEQPGWFYLSIGWREFLYLGYALVILAISASGFVLAGLIVAAGAMLQTGNMFFTAIVAIAVLVGVVALLLVAGRLHLVLPGAAVGDRRMSLRRSFELTRGNSWRIVGGFLLLAMLNLVVNVMSSMLERAAESSPAAATILFAVLVIVASTVIGFITLSYMSFCYWFFVPPPEEGDLV